MSIGYLYVGGTSSSLSNLTVPIIFTARSDIPMAPGGKQITPNVFDIALKCKTRNTNNMASEKPEVLIIPLKRVTCEMN